MFVHVLDGVASTRMLIEDKSERLSTFLPTNLAKFPCNVVVTVCEKGKTKSCVNWGVKKLTMGIGYPQNSSIFQA